jgi:hypothetical protein
MGDTNDDEHLMWMTRAQWNPLGRVVDWSGSDPSLEQEPALLIALAVVTNRSPYTRFSQDGGGQLPGFEDTEDPGRYRVNQWMGETAFKVRGLAWQQEFHWKEIDDRVAGGKTKLIGNYAQLGYFFHNVWDAVPRALETTLRFSIYDPVVGQKDDLQREFAIACNWFFSGHRNKLTVDFTHFDFEDLESTAERDGSRFRVQWDVSI